MVVTMAKKAMMAMMANCSVIIDARLGLAQLTRQPRQQRQWGRPFAFPVLRAATATLRALRLRIAMCHSGGSVTIASHGGGLCGMKVRLLSNGPSCFARISCSMHSMIVSGVGLFPGVCSVCGVLPARA
jgi:hypothetical protein